MAERAAHTGSRAADRTAACPAWEQPKEIKLKSIVIDLTQPRIEKHNYRITDDELGYGGAKAKYQMNVAAIRTLQTIEAERALLRPKNRRYFQSMSVGAASRTPLTRARITGAQNMPNSKAY